MPDDGPPEFVPRPDLICELCLRVFTRVGLTKHHTKPKSKGGTVDHIELLCGQCHGTVHASFTNETLAKVYPTIDQLRTAAELQPYLKWVRKLPAGRVKQIKQRKRRR